MKTRLRAALTAVMVFAAAALGGDCEDDIVKDPTFRDWCGDTLCSWTTDSGHIERVPTWNTDDFGVSFVDQGTQISQVTDEHQATCILFSTTADIDPAAQMELLVDFDSDGVVDFQSPLGATRWRNVQAEITAPEAYAGITFHLRKEGTGTAVLAQMRVTSTTGCTAPPVQLPPQPFGGSCATGADCRAGLVCAPNGRCSECDDEAPCGDGGTCVQQAYVPWQCDPGQRLGAPGSPCTGDADCASGACDGGDLVSFATLFAQDSGCPTDVPCEPDAAIDGSMSACACYLKHVGTCR